MGPAKTFDCVRMKAEIQQALAERFKGLAPEEAAAAQRDLIDHDPVMGEFCRRIPEARTRATRAPRS